MVMSIEETMNIAARYKQVKSSKGQYFQVCPRCINIDYFTPSTNKMEATNFEHG
jgi:hypothetical protein